MSKKVITSDACGCACSQSGVNNGGSNSGGKVIVRNKPGIAIGNVIYEYSENGNTIYELDDLIEVFPQVAFSNDSEVTEIGATIAEVIFSGNITQGTYPIVTRQISPNPGGLDLTAPFNFSKLNVKRTTPGTAELHTVTAIDDQGNSTARQSGVIFKHSFYRGYSELTSLNQAQIKALVTKTLNDNIVQEYGGGDKSYEVPNSPSVPRFIYWSGPVGTPPVAAVEMDGDTVPIIQLANVNVTNSNDGTIITPYWVVRTTAKFDPATYLMTVF